MIIKNLTSKVQSVTVRGYARENEAYTIYLEEYGTTDIEKAYVVHPELYAGILQISPSPFSTTPAVEEIVEEFVGPVNQEEEEEVLQEEEQVIVEENVSQEEEEELIQEDEITQPTTNEDIFICETCGAEFASARGLATHKNRSHANN